MQNDHHQELHNLLLHLKSKPQGLDVPFAVLGSAGAYKPSGQRYPLTEVNPLKPTMPVSGAALTENLPSLIRALEQSIPNVTTSDGALNMLERFGGFVAATNERGTELGGISWFDAARQKISLDVCGERVLVLRTDISGIQDFIYRIESDRALKSLRARSFYLELLAVHTLREILRLTGLTRAQVVYIGGGGYQLYLPPETRETVENYLRDFDQWLWQEHAGTLGLSWAFEEVSRAEAEAGGDVQTRLSSTLGAQKARRRSHDLESVFSGALDPYARLAREEDLTDRLAAFGGLLPDATHLEVKRGEGGAGWLTLEGVSYHPVKLLPNHAQDGEKIALNRFEMSGDFPMLTGNYVTRVADLPENYPPLSEADIAEEDLGYPGGVATHAELAHVSLGQPRLALFRCDADNMGSFFSGGIPSHNAARHATLSRLMSLFFQGYVNAICARTEPLLPEVPQAPRTGTHGRYLNIIYSGGDDAVVVGAWNEVLTFAVDLRKAYRLFTGGNAALGLSGGSFIAKHQFPVHRMAERAHEAEKLAKQATYQDGKRLLKKDGFVPFLTADTPAEDTRAAVRWNIFAALEETSHFDLTLDILQTFLQLKETKSGVPTSVSLCVSSGFLWKLKAFADRENDVWRLPLLHYALARAHVPAQHSAEWKQLEHRLQQPATWPHLAHVLGFLHLARAAQNRHSQGNSQDS